MNVLPVILSTVKRAHAYCDKEMESLDNVCEKGCGACCYQNVYTNAWEEIALIEYINKQVKKKTRSVLQSNLKKWFFKFNNATREASQAAPLSPHEMDAVDVQFRDQRVACPLLINGTCAVYPVRPLACRVHIETEDPGNCKNDPHKITCSEARRIHKQVIEACKFDPSIYPLMSKPVAYAVAGELGGIKKSKPFMGIVADHRR